jgi:hypothetical protein
MNANGRRGMNAKIGCGNYSASHRKQDEIAGSKNAPVPLRKNVVEE